MFGDERKEKRNGASVIKKVHWRMVLGSEKLSPLTRGRHLRIEHSRKQKYDSWMWALEETGSYGAMSTRWDLDNISRE